MLQKNPLNDQQVRWIEEHLWLFNGPSRTVTKADLQSLFAIYSWVTGQNHRATGCGRCVASAKAAVWAAYKQIQQ